MPWFVHGAADGSKLRGRDMETSEKPISFDIITAAKFCGIGRSSIYEAVRDGRLKARKLGHKTLLLRRDLEAFVESLPVAPIVGSRPRKNGKAA
jgi:excisionase family DNA binding protein